MKKKITGTLALLACSTFANANWVGSVNYSHFSDKLGPTQNLDLGTFGATFGYKFDLTEKIRLVPEARLGFGLGGDSITTNVPEIVQSDFEINDYFGVALRGEYVLSDDLYAYAVISHQNIEIKLDGVRVDGQVSAFAPFTRSETEFGAGVGLGWQINERNALEASYEDIDGTDLITVGYRFNF